jgi:pyrimidine deaminase RibD-like protein
MRGSLSHARLLTAALVALVAVAAGASAALASSSTTSANGLTVTAALSPDSVMKGDIVSERVAVTNTSNSAENLAIRIIGPLASLAPQTVAVTLQPRASFARSLSFSAALLSPGTHTLTVIAANRATGTVTTASASVTRN